METPCPRCGTLKTESVKHGLVYNALWQMGYHLRRCSFCNRRRLLKRSDKNRPHPNDLTAEQLTEHFNRRIASALKRDGAAAVVLKGMAPDAVVPTPSPRPPQAMAPQPVKLQPVTAQAATPQPVTPATSVAVAEIEYPEDVGSCPDCGHTKFRRSRRRWYERWMKGPKMARCLKCSCRYPYPG